MKTSKCNWEETLLAPGTLLHVNFCYWGNCPDLHWLLGTSARMSTWASSLQVLVRMTVALAPSAGRGDIYWSGRGFSSEWKWMRRPEPREADRLCWNLPQGSGTSDVGKRCEFSVGSKGQCVGHVSYQTFTIWRSKTINKSNNINNDICLIR